MMRVRIACPLSQLAATPYGTSKVAAILGLNRVGAWRLVTSEEEEAARWV